MMDDAILLLLMADIEPAPVTFTGDPDVTFDGDGDVYFGVE